MPGLGSGAQHDARGEVGAESLLQQPQPAQILGTHGGARLHLDPDHPAVTRLQDEIHLNAVSITEMEQARSGLRPLGLRAQLTRDERLDQPAGQV